MNIKFLKKFLACVVVSTLIWFFCSIPTLLGFLFINGGDSPNFPWPYRIFWICLSMAICVPVNVLIIKEEKIDLL